MIKKIIYILNIILILNSCQNFIDSYRFSKPVYYKSDNEMLFTAKYQGVERFFILEKETNSLKHLLPEIKDVLYPVYSSELNLIAYGQLNEEKTNSNIWIVNPDTKEKVCLTKSKNIDERPFFTKNNDYIYFLRYSIGKTYFIYRINMETFHVEPVTDEAYWIVGFPIISNDNNFIYFSRAKSYTDEVIVKYTIKEKKYTEITRYGYGFIPFVTSDDTFYFVGKSYTYEEFVNRNKNIIQNFNEGIFQLLNDNQWTLIYEHSWSNHYLDSSPYSKRIFINNFLLNFTEIDLKTRKIIGKYDLLKIPIERK